jgi:hypothetical protein
MIPLPLEPEDRIRARRAVAANLRWPDGAVDACIKLEAEHRGWAVFWTRGWGASAPPGFRAAHIHHPMRELRAATAEEMRERLAEVDAEIKKRTP